jgi:hypothetical protein
MPSFEQQFTTMTFANGWKVQIIDVEAKQPDGTVPYFSPNFWKRRLGWAGGPLELQVNNPAGEAVFFEPQCPFTPGDNIVAELYNLTMEMVPDVLGIVRFFRPDTNLEVAARSIQYELHKYEVHQPDGTLTVAV